MKVLVTGGTGFVGGGVVSSLCAAGHRVRVLSRHRAGGRPVFLSPAQPPEFIAGNVLDAVSLAGALRGSDAVVHLVGIISEIGSATFENVHVSGTENVLRAAKEQGTARFIHMSALGTRPMAVSRYHQTKWAAEEAVRNSGLAWTIFRPSLIYGPQDNFVNLFARISRFSPLLPVLSPSRVRFQPVSLQAVSACFIGALADARSIGNTYDVCGPDRLSMNDILDAIMAVLGRKRFKVHIPLAAARFQAWFLEQFYPRVLRRAAPLNREQLIMLQEGNEGDGRAANELFGLKHAQFQEGIAYLHSG